MQDKRHDDDDMQLTEDLAARMPQALSQIQAGTVPDQHMAMPPTSPAGLNMLSPMSMDLTNNSMDLQHAQRVGLQQAAQIPLPTEFTRSITGAIPALSTLVEEDEEAGLDSVGGLQATSAPQQPAASPGMTMSMDLTGHTPHRGAPSAQQDLDQLDAFTSPAPNLPPPGGDLMDNVSPTSPFVLQEMMGSRGPAAGGGMDDTDDLKNKWGFTPGADDTLDVSHGVWGVNFYKDTQCVLIDIQVPS